MMLYIYVPLVVITYSLVQTIVSAALLRVLGATERFFAFFRVLFRYTIFSFFALYGLAAFFNLIACRVYRCCSWVMDNPPLFTCRTWAWQVFYPSSLWMIGVLSLLAFGIQVYHMSLRYNLNYGQIIMVLGVGNLCAAIVWWQLHVALVPLLG